MNHLQARLRSNLCSLLLPVLGVMATAVSAPSALAGEAATAPNASTNKFARPYATVWRIQGEVTATPSDTSKARVLKAGDTVYVNEKLTTGAASEAVFKADDASLIALRPKSAFVTDRFSAQGKSNDSASFRLLVGGLRVITGWIGHVNRRNYQVVTPTATIGIRGTDHEPYVVSDDIAETSEHPTGTYDKVNRGGTTLETNGNEVDIPAGKVGYARQVTPVKTRALMSLVLPVLLTKVPDFYVPGQFDAELDALSATQDETSARLLKELSQRPACSTTPVATAWLKQLDSAVVRRDADAVLRLFAPGVVVRATVRNKDASLSTVELGRDEFAQSTIAAVKAMTKFSQRRLSIEAQLLQPGNCDQIAVKSAVIEQGQQNAKAYRFESVEQYVLENQSGQWVATQASTTQK